MVEAIATKNRNASSTMFGFDFQVNAAIYLTIENIQNLEKIRLEGRTEDIELTMKGGKKIYAQAKSIVEASIDFRNVRDKLQKAIKSLSDADGENVESLILITNSVNPLNEESSKGFFYGPPTDVRYDDLPKGGREVIDNIIARLGVELDKDKFHIKKFRFETNDYNERYKVIRQEIQDFIGGLHISQNISATELMKIWQSDIFQNGSDTDVTKKIKKEEIIWPIIVLVVGNDMPDNLSEDYDQGMMDEIFSRYANLINNSIERYEIVTSILYDYNEYSSDINGMTMREKTKLFVSEHWKDYIEKLGLSSLEEELKEGISKLVMSKIIQQRYAIERIRKGVGL